jgi:hypothetical protein
VLLLPAYLAVRAASVSPIDGASETVVGYILGFGPLGLVALALAWLLFRGYRLVPPGFEGVTRDAARADARADLIAERDRIIAEKHIVEEQRDEAMQVATGQLVPLLVSFTASTQALLPLLQRLVAQPGKQLRRGDQGW